MSVNNSKHVSNSSTSNLNSSNWSELGDDSALEQILDEPFDLNNSRLRLDEKYSGFDNNSGETWIYPTNLPIRTYQFNITRTALFRNTLVVLPTGLGKTLIAAVVMYNIYRWYPLGKVIFMAPTRPLVAQQIEACCKIVGIPQSDTAELTGKNNKKARSELWQSKRVFFATPQVVQSDIADVECGFPFDTVKLIVVDEAHKARGRYAYTEVVRSIHSRNPYFRILALSATPGRRVEDVAEVIHNLFISHLEVRWDTSIDVACYTHKRNVSIIEVPLGEQLSAIRNELIDIIDPYIRSLIEFGVLNGSTSSLTRNILIMEQQRFRRMSMQERHPRQAAVSTDFSIAISLYHALELLERHGLRVFINYFDEDGKEKFFVALNPRLRRMVENLRREVGPNPFSVSVQTMTNGEIQRMPQNLDFGHPKFEMAKKYILEHFEKTPDSKVIIFCEYRESVMLMYRLLLQSRPLIQPRVFVGQGGTGAIRAVTQKEQIQIMDDFRKGVSNTLVATSVAEEGIDVGEVDLIICFDISTKNPTRLVQRIGRTGRKRQGNVIMLATEGKEHAVVKEVLASKDKTNQKLARSREVRDAMYKQSPRIVPPEFDPKCLQTYIQQPENKEIVTTKSKDPKRGKKPSKPIPASQDMRKFFKKIELDKDDKQVFDEEPSSSIIAVENNISEIVEEEEPLESLNYFDDLYSKLKILRRKLDRPPKFKSISNIADAIRSNEYSKELKVYLLSLNFGFVKESHEAMEAILALGDEEENDIANMRPEEKKIRKDYANIKEVLGTRFGIIDFLDKYSDSSGKNNCSGAEKNFSSIFDGLHQRDFYDDNQNFIADKLKEISNVSRYFPKKEEQHSIVYEEQEDNHNSVSLLNDEFEKIGSKYASQWQKLDRNRTNPIIPLRIENQSTPLRNVVPRRSIGKCEASPIVKDLSRRNISKIEQSPIMKAFAKAKEKEDSLSRFFDSTFDFESPKKGAVMGAGNSIRNSVRTLPIICEEENVEEPSPSSDHKTSADLFDDDFDDILATSDFLENIPNNDTAKNSYKDQFMENIPKDDTSKNADRNVLNNIPTDDTSTNTDMVTVSQILEMAEKSEQKDKMNQSNVTNPELEDFDLNDFLEPFDEEIGEEIPFSQDEKNSSQKENRLPQTENTVRSSFHKAPMSSINKNVVEIKSPNRPLPTPPETSPSILYKKPNSLRMKLFGKSLSSSKSDITAGSSSSIPIRRSLSLGMHENVTANESIIRIAGSKRSLKRIIRSSGSESDDGPKLTRKKFKAVSLSDDSDDDFQSKTKNRSAQNDFSVDSILQDDEEVYPPSQAISTDSRRERILNHRKRQRKRFAFVDDEAQHSGSETEGECDASNTVSQYMLDSIVVNDDDIEDDPSVNMQAKYLQSIRSPIRRPGAFKIPAPRVYQDHSKIYSQVVRNESIGAYKENSFVVSSDEEDEDCISVGDISELSPLKDSICKADRRNKRKAAVSEKFNAFKAKRKKFVRNCIGSSEDDE